jgi:dynein heavy chain 1
MKMSPYYKVFEEEALVWEDRLNRIHVLFDVQIDVQRQWVYLEGIFTGNVDIKHLLPVETSRFASINAEFLAVMKKISKSPLVLDVIQIPNIQKSLERLAELLGKIQKALGEYLEKERSNFPRFYFVGDEDLLEIIGNSKDISRLQKHFRKMFAGIAQIVLSEDQTRIVAIQSREGEQVDLSHPVILTDRRINEWLSALEKEMRQSLATELARAVQNLETCYSEQASSEVFLKWADQFPAQLVVLAAQVMWTKTTEGCLSAASTPSSALAIIDHLLNVLADAVLNDLPPILRRKCEHLITELVHERDVTRDLVKKKSKSPQNFTWLYHMRFYLDSRVKDITKTLRVQMANASFLYG